MGGPGSAPGPLKTHRHQADNKTMTTRRHIPFRVLLAVGVALQLAFIAAAGAWADAALADDPYPEARPGYAVELDNPRASDDRLLAKTITVAMRFWADRGVTGQRPTATIADDIRVCWLENDQRECAIADGVGDEHVGVIVPAYRVWLATRERWRPGERWRMEHADNSDREALCRVVVHEVGHTLGQEHTATGVMSYDDSMPWACVKWRRSLDRTVRRHAQRSSRGPR